MSKIDKGSNNDWMFGGWKPKQNPSQENKSSDSNKTEPQAPSAPEPKPEDIYIPPPKPASSNLTTTSNFPTAVPVEHSLAKLIKPEAPPAIDTIEGLKHFFEMSLPEISLDALIKFTNAIDGKADSFNTLKSNDFKIKPPQEPEKKETPTQSYPDEPYIPHASDFFAPGPEDISFFMNNGSLDSLITLKEMFNKIPNSLVGKGLTLFETMTAIKDANSDNPQTILGKEIVKNKEEASSNDFAELGYHLKTSLELLQVCPKEDLKKQLKENFLSLHSQTQKLLKLRFPLHNSLFPPAAAARFHTMSTSRGHWINCKDPVHYLASQDPQPLFGSGHWTRRSTDPIAAFYPVNERIQNLVRELETSSVYQILADQYGSQEFKSTFLEASNTFKQCLEKFPPAAAEQYSFKDFEKALVMPRSMPKIFHYRNRVPATQKSVIQEEDLLLFAESFNTIYKFLLEAYIRCPDEDSTLREKIFHIITDHQYLTHHLLSYDFSTGKREHPLKTQARK